MKIIDLLNKIAKGEEVPNFWWNGCIHKIEKDGRGTIKIFDTYCKKYKKIELEQLNDEIKIIEEVEDKEYEDIDYADNLEQGEYIDYANDYEVKFDIVKNRKLINALIRNQKYILEQLNK